MLCILVLVIDSQAIGFIACIWYSSWVCTITCEVAKLADDTLAAHIDVLGVLATLSCNQVWTDIKAEACRTGVATRELGVHIDGFVLTTGLHRALAIGIIPIVAHKSVFIHCKESVFLVPLVLLLGCLFIFLAVILHAARVDVDKVAVSIVLVLVTVVNGRTVGRSLLRAVVLITHVAQLELMSVSLLIGIGEVIACVERAIELYAALREVLLLARDAVHVVIAHCKGIGSRLAVGTLIAAIGTCQTVQCIVAVGMAHLPACLATLWEWSIVLNTEYVAHCVITIGIVHNSTSLGIHHEVLQTASLRVIAVERLRSVAVLQIGALLKLIITNLVHIVVAIGLVTTDVVYLPTEVIAVGDLFLIGVNHFQEAVMAVVLPLCYVGCHRLVWHNQCAYRLQDLTHLAVVIFDGATAVLTKHQSADTVVRRVDTTVMVLHVVLRMVGIVDSRQPSIIILIVDGLSLLLKVGGLLGEHIAQSIVGEAITCCVYS